MSSTTAKNLNMENIIRKVYDESTESLQVSGTFTAAPPVGASTLAEQQVQSALLNTINTSINNQTVSISTPRVYFTTSLIDTSVTNITNSTYLQLVASTTQTTTKIQIVEDIGEYMALYIGSSGNEAILCALPLGGGEVEVSVPSGTRLSIKSLNNNITTGKIIFNLLR